MSCTAAKKRELVEDHVGYARNIARKLFNSRIGNGMGEEEFESAAYYGLCEAARRYDSSKQVVFKSYCYPRVKGAIIDELRQYGSYRVSANRYQRNQAKRIKKIKGDDYQLPNAGFDCFFPQLNVSILNKEDEEQIEFSYADMPSQEDAMLFAENRDVLRKCIRRLPEKERMIIVLHYFVEIPIIDLCPMLNASKSWLSKLHVRGLDRVRKFIAEEQAQSVEKVQRPLLN